MRYYGVPAPLATTSFAGLDTDAVIFPPDTFGTLITPVPGLNDTVLNDGAFSEGTFELDNAIFFISFLTHLYKVVYSVDRIIFLINADVHRAFRQWLSCAQ